MVYASYSKLSKELKNGIEILVGQAVFKTFKILFLSITQESLGLLKCHFWVPWAIYFIIFQKGVDNFERENTKHANFWLEVQYPLSFTDLGNVLMSFLNQ